MRPKDYQTSKRKLSHTEYSDILYDDLVFMSEQLAEVAKNIERLNKFIEALKEEVLLEAEK